MQLHAHALALALASASPLGERHWELCENQKHSKKRGCIISWLWRILPPNMSDPHTLIISWNLLQAIVLSDRKIMQPLLKGEIVVTWAQYQTEIVRSSSVTAPPSLKWRTGQLCKPSFQGMGRSHFSFFIALSLAPRRALWWSASLCGLLIPMTSPTFATTSCRACKMSITLSLAPKAVGSLRRYDGWSLITPCCHPCTEALVYVEVEDESESSTSEFLLNYQDVIFFCLIKTSE